MDKKREDGASTPGSTHFKKILIVVFATIAFLMTAYATSGGARLFLSESYAWIGITALAVGFLAFTSLVLGDGITSGRVTQIVLVTPFYVVAVAICWITSFASYHQQFLSAGGSDLANAETNLRQMSLYTNEIKKDINDQYANDRKALLTDGTLKQYSAKMWNLADLLRDRNTKEEIAAELEALILEKNTELREREKQLQSQQNEMQAEALGIIQQTEAIARDVDQKQGQLQAAQDRIVNIEAALRAEEGDPTLPAGSRGFLAAGDLAGQLVDDPACNRRRRVGTGGGTPGTCFHTLGLALEEARLLAQEARNVYEAGLVGLTVARQQQAAYQSEVDKVSAALTAAALEADEGVSIGNTLDADGFLQSVNALIDKPSPAIFMETADYCAVITEVLVNLPSFSEIPDCAPQQITAVFRKLETLDADNGNNGFVCENGERRDEIINTLRAEIADLSGPQRLEPISRAYDVMRSDVLETCMVSAEQRGLDMAPYRQDITGLMDRINPSQDSISTAMGKIQSLFNGTASARDYFPALLALLQELSLLLSKLFWDASVLAKVSRKKDDFDVSELDLNAKPGDTEPVLAAKNIILNASFERQGYRLGALFDEEYSQEMRAQMRLIIDTLIRKQLARKSGRGILISEAGIAEIGRRILRHNESVEGLSAKPDTAPKAAANPVTEQAKTTDAQPHAPNAIPSAEDVSDVQDDPETNSGDGMVAQTSENDDGESGQRPRRRRPVVVRPNFRREI